jgi:uncharacterized protein YqeY
MSSALKQQITNDMKTAMKAKDKHRLDVIRLMLAALKQREVDERIELTDADILTILDKMVKQRRDSIKQYSDAGRQDLADVEAAEIDVIQFYLPEQLSEQEIADMVAAAMTETNANAMSDMGKVMAVLKPKLQGRADIGQISKLVKNQLN